MAWPPVAADLYVHGAPESYFTGVPAGTITAAGEAAYGELATELAPRCGGDPASWTWAHTAGQAHATRDVCMIWGHALAVSNGLVLPGEGADPHWVKRAEAIRARWVAMGSNKAPLYAGLVDATPDTLEGKTYGWATAAPYGPEEAEA